MKINYRQVNSVIIDAFKNTDKDIATSKYLIHIDEIIDDMLSYISKGEDVHAEIDPRIEGHSKIIFNSIKEAKSFLLTAHIIYVCVKIYRVATFGDNIDYDVIKMYKKAGVNLDLNLNLNQASNDDDTYLGYTIEDINNRANILFDETSPSHFYNIKKYVEKYIVSGDQKNKEKVISEYINVKEYF